MTTTSPSSVRPKRGAAFRRVGLAGGTLLAVGASAFGLTAPAQADDSGLRVGVMRVGATWLTDKPAGEWQVGNDAFPVLADSYGGRFTVTGPDGEELCGKAFPARGESACEVHALPVGHHVLTAKTIAPSGAEATEEFGVEVVDQANPADQYDDLVASPGNGDADAPAVPNPNPGTVDPGFAPFPGQETPGELLTVTASVDGERTHIELRDRDALASYSVEIAVDGEPRTVALVQGGQGSADVWGLESGRHRIDVSVWDNGGTTVVASTEVEVPGDGDDATEPVVARPNPGETDPGFTVRPGEDAHVPGKGTIQSSVQALGDDGIQLDLSDPQEREAYMVVVRVDGVDRRHVPVSRHTNQSVVKELAAGKHIVEVLSENVVIASHEIDLAGAGEGPGAEPIVARPNPGETDPGFTVRPGEGSGGEAQQPGALRIADVEWTDDNYVAAQFEVQGTSGDHVRLSRGGVVLAEQVLRDDRPFALTIPITTGEIVKLEAVVTSPSGGVAHQELEVQAPGVVANPAPGEVDPGFTPGGDEHGKPALGEGTIQAGLRYDPFDRLVIDLSDEQTKDPYNVQILVDERLRGVALVGKNVVSKPITVDASQSHRVQILSNGTVIADQTVESKADHEGAGPGEGTLVSSITSPANGTVQIDLTDPTADRGGYGVQIWIDGRLRGAMTVKQDTTTKYLRLDGGEHTVAIKANGTVLAEQTVVTGGTPGVVVPGDGTIAADVTTLAGSIRVGLSDRTADGGYVVQIWVDGVLRGAATVREQASTESITATAGEHTVEVKSNGVVIASKRVTV